MLNYLNLSKKYTSAYFLLLLANLLCVVVQMDAQQKPPESFSYDELKTLYDQETLSPPLSAKLKNLLTIPLVDNAQKNRRVSLSNSSGIGECLRVATWNIERGLEYDAIAAALGNEKDLTVILNERKSPLRASERAELLKQAALLRAADVIVLNEVDNGMKRTDYRNVAGDLAKHLRMNYAYGVEFVELSPVHLSELPPSSDNDENDVSKIIKVDPALYKGLTGTAILSRFPLENVRLVPFVAQSYDWYKSEKQKTGLLEKGRRELSKRIFLEETLREVRRGGRMMLLADIADARLPAGRLTIVATHLENKTKSANRLRELNELLGAIKDIKNPIVVAGDMNTSTEDLTPTSFRHEFTKRYGNPKYWLRMGISLALGLDFLEDLVFDGITLWHNQSDPTVHSIPLFAPNPERKFFQALKEFRFSDGGAFDFRGDPSRSANGRAKTLANSNERGGKGFITTFQVNRPIKFIGRYKLDWIFVKPMDLNKPNDNEASYRLAPHFGRTLTKINKLLKSRISDHHPLIVDLPIAEPPNNPANKNE